jgi:uncharacterized protein YbjT (DUF2867 family)
MDKSEKVVLVIGATGQQGGATARHLIANGFKVRALTRYPQRSAAKALAEAGAEVVLADSEDRASLETAFEGAYGVFSMQTLRGIGRIGELRQGKNIADAAKAADIQHIVYTSIGGAERNADMPHLGGKWQIEQYIRQLALPATILRPVEFMENFYSSRLTIWNGTFPILGLRPERKRQLIAVDDIGAFAAISFENPQEYIGKAVEIAGDALTEAEIAETFSRVIDRPVQLVQVTEDPDFAGDEEFLKIVRWFNEEGFRADIPALRKLYPPLKTFETWLRQTGWENAEDQKAQWRARQL